MNCRLLLAACAIAAALNVRAETNAVASEIDQKLGTVEKMLKEPVKKLTRAEVEMRPEVQRRTGGFIDAPAKGTALLILDLRKKAGGAPGQFKTVFEKLSKFNVVSEQRQRDPTVTAEREICERIAAAKAAFGIAVVEDSEASGLAVFPEERVAVVNATKFQGGSDPVRREERVLKEIWRGFGFVVGLGYAPFKNDVLQPVFDVDGLDALVYQVMQPMNYQKSYRLLAKFGATHERHIPYRLACKEGWAPAPTNDYQKAVWKQVFSPPAKPMKIEFDPKKGR